MSDSDDIFAASGVEAPQTPAPNQPYRVLARKYRPTSFSQLIGQDAMVQTLGNAIKRDRLAHAFLMTGVRGVGKTSTARLIAKALNCIGPDGQGGPTIDPCGECEPCRAIAEGSYIDVIEMDAASHTGVDDVREIIEAVRYSSVSARYKIYIIDEVHMLSKNAFNALLKTLEEPPPHVKFIFATTEVNKVPITVLSRCQRFDLKRIKAEQLSAHFANICGKEGVRAEQEALDLIAQAAEGSVRDGLSILDQAIAHAAMESAEGSEDGEIKGTQIREMLGLSDRSATRRMFGKLLDGEVGGLLDDIAEQYQIGVEPLALMNGLLSLCHQVTLFKVGRASDPTLSDEAKAMLSAWAEQLSFPVLHRLWQLLLKGYEEVRDAHVPRESCEMALLRVLCAAEMPDPGKLAKMLAAGNIGVVNTQAAAPVAPNMQVTQETAAVLSAIERSSPPRPIQEEVEPKALPKDLYEILNIVGRSAVPLQGFLKQYLRIIDFNPPEITYAAVPQLRDSDINSLRDILNAETGTAWTIASAEGDGKPSIAEQAQLDAQAERQKILDSPMIKAAMEAFPGAELLESGDAPPYSGSQPDHSAQARS